MSVMGMLGQHYAVSLYLGAEGFHGFAQMQAAGPSALRQIFFEVPQLHASFEDREELDKKDREILKKLDLKLRGRQAWPMFRSYRSGCYPWFPTQWEVRFLTHALEQTLDVAPRAKKDPFLLLPADPGACLVRVSRNENGILTWEDRILPAPARRGPVAPALIAPEVLGELKGLSQRIGEIELDCLLAPGRIQERAGRPFCIHVLLMLDGRSGMILGCEVLQADPSLEEMQRRLPVMVASYLLRIGAVPMVAHVRSDLLVHLLQPLAAELGFEIEKSPVLPSLDAAKKELLRFFG